MTIQRPTHPVAPDATTNAGFGLLSELTELVMPATKKISAPDQDHEINRPLADDYQAPYQGATSGGGLDSDTLTKDWYPDVDRVEPMTTQAVYTPMPVAGPPVPVTIVPTLNSSYTNSLFRTLFGLNAFYIGSLYQLDTTTVTQVIPFDLSRTHARLYIYGGHAAAVAANYCFGISSNRDGTDYVVLDSVNITMDIDTTGEVWAGIIPLNAYAAANMNNICLGVQLDSVYTGVTQS